MEQIVSLEVLEAFTRLLDALVSDSLKRVAGPAKEEGSSRGLLNKKEAATYLHVSTPTITALCKAGEIKAITIPGTTAVRYTMRSLDNLIERQANHPESGGG